MNEEELNAIAEKKFDKFFRTATSTGVWFIAFILSVGMFKWTDGSGFACALIGVSFGFTAVIGLLMVFAMFEAQEASRNAHRKAHDTGTNQSQGRA